MLCSGNGEVDGEVYAIPPGLWPALDAWEDCPEVYARVRQQLNDGRWVWVYRQPSHGQRN